MRKIDHFFYLCLLMLVSLLAIHCKKNNENTSPNPPVPPSDTLTISKSVHVIDSTVLILNSDSTLLNQGSYQYTFSDSIPDFKVNDIIVGTVNGGYIRKISSVNKSSNKLILETTQASMEDVFVNKGFNLNTGIDNLSRALSAGYSFDVSGQTIYDDGHTTIKINKGDITVNGDWNFGFNYKKASLDTFEMSCKNAVFNGQFDINVSTSQSTNLGEHSSTLARVAKYNTFIVGDVPVVLYTEVELRCLFSAAINTKSESNFIVNTNNTADAGIVYKNSQWQNFFKNNSASSLTVAKDSANLNAGIKLAIVPYISFRLYRVLGPYFSLGLQESVQANASVAIPSLAWDFSAAAWLQTTIGVKAQILGKSLFDFDKVWNSDSLLYTTPYSLSKISGDNQTGDSGTYLSNPLKVRVVDNNNRPQSNAIVYFDVTAGSGSVEKTIAGTDNDGYAETKFKLGPEAGIQTVSAGAKKADGSFIINAPVKFAATTGQLQNQDSSFTDPRDGQVYTFKHIGTQVWMTQNLNYAAPGSWCYDDNTGNCAVYGRLYDWNTALTVAPQGWHLPSYAEWTTLVTDYFGGGSAAGEAMRATTLWNATNTGATNSSGFAGLPGGGWFGPNDLFANIGLGGYWWSSTEYDTGDAWYCTLGQGSYLNFETNFVDWYKYFGFSVRCIRN